MMMMNVGVFVDVQFGGVVVVVVVGGDDGCEKKLLYYAQRRKHAKLRDACFLTKQCTIDAPPLTTDAKIGEKL